MEQGFRATHPGDRSIILAEQRWESRTGLGAALVVGAVAVASWLAVSAPQNVSELADSVVPAADAATLFGAQPPPLGIHNGGSVMEAAATTEAELTTDDITKLQTKLKALGFDPGKADGVVGPRTLSALNAYRKSLGLQPSDVVDRQAVAPLTP